MRLAANSNSSYRNGGNAMVSVINLEIKRYRVLITETFARYYVQHLKIHVRKRMSATPMQRNENDLFRQATFRVWPRLQATYFPKDT